MMHAEQLLCFVPPWPPFQGCEKYHENGNSSQHSGNIAVSAIVPKRAHRRRGNASQLRIPPKLNRGNHGRAEEA